MRWDSSTMTRSHCTCFNPGRISVRLASSSDVMTFFCSSHWLTPNWSRMSLPLRTKNFSSNFSLSSRCHWNSGSVVAVGVAVFEGAGCLVIVPEGETRKRIIPNVSFHIPYYIVPSLPVVPHCRIPLLENHYLEKERQHRPFSLPSSGAFGLTGDGSIFLSNIVLILRQRLLVCL